MAEGEAKVRGKENMSGLKIMKKFPGHQSTNDELLRLK